MGIVIILVCLLVLLGIALLLHHCYVHGREDSETSSAQRESCWCACYFQPKDIAHYESWCVICLTNAWTLGVFASHRLVASGVACCLLMLAVVCFVLSGEDGHMCRPVLQHLANHGTWVLVAFTNALTLFFVIKYGWAL